MAEAVRLKDRSSQYDGPSPPHRFVRLNPRFDRDVTLELLKVRVFVCVCVRENRVRFSVFN